jgi:prepilin-type N-terminal cleavage/methylation domain-containing protein
MTECRHNLLPAKRLRTLRRGFTVAELMVVVAVAAIMAAVVVPMAMDSSGIQAVSAARRINADLQYAQNEAISSQTDVTVTFNPSDESYRLSNASGGLIHPMTKKDFTVDFRTESGLGQVDIVSASFGGSASVTFDPIGAPSSGGTVTIQAGPHLVQLSVAGVTGLVTITE